MVRCAWRASRRSRQKKNLRPLKRGKPSRIMDIIQPDQGARQTKDVPGRKLRLLQDGIRIWHWPPDGGTPAARGTAASQTLPRPGRPIGHFLHPPPSDERITWPRLSRARETILPRQTDDTGSHASPPSGGLSSRGSPSTRPPEESGLPISSGESVVSHVDKSNSRCCPVLYGRSACQARNS